MNKIEQQAMETAIKNNEVLRSRLAKYEDADGKALGVVVPGGEPDWPEYHHGGMGCGLEDRGITDRYEAMQHGWDDAFERCITAFNDWLAGAPKPADHSEDVRGMVEQTHCQCGDSYPANSYDAGFIDGSGMCANCDAAIPATDLIADGWEKSLVSAWPAEDECADGSWVVGGITDGDKYPVITVDADQYDAPGDSEKIAKALIALWAKALTAPQPAPDVAMLVRDAERYRLYRLGMVDPDSFDKVMDEALAAHAQNGGE